MSDPKDQTAFVAVVGAPNCGKTTLFNWLTGSKFRTVNYPGATVEYSMGQSASRFGEPQLTLMDTPGTYSLLAQSPDEKVTVEAIFRHRLYGQAKLVIAVVDATQLSRHLLIVRQLQSSGFRVIVAMTMIDLLAARGEDVDVVALEQLLGARVVLIDGRLGGGVEELVKVARELEVARHQAGAAVAAIDQAKLDSWTHEKTEDVMRELSRTDSAVRKARAKSPVEKRRDSLQRSLVVDKILLHPIFGLALFFLIMATLFTSIFWAAAPLMDVVDQSIGWVGDFVQARGEGRLWASFLSSGVISSFGAVMVFVPQIFILFLGIGLLEDSGYLARAATLADKPFSKLGLNGRSFVPLLSANACAVPAMMATRTMGSRRERLLTLFVIPLMSCSARLPVYALLLTFIFGAAGGLQAGLALAGIYIVSLFVGAIAALIAGKFLKTGETSYFMLELPVYRRPKLRLVTRSALTRTMSYIKRAGPPIFVFSMLIWVATTFPRYDLPTAGERMKNSFAVMAGHAIEPVFKPMGVDWRVGVGLMSAFAAREVFVSSLAVVFNVEEAPAAEPTGEVEGATLGAEVARDDSEDSMRESLLSKMREAEFENGEKIFTLASVLGLVMFFMVALQCMSTTAMAIRESGMWRFAVLQLVVFNVAAYLLAVGVVQGLRALGVA